MIPHILHIEGFVFLEDNRMGKKTMTNSEEKPSRHKIPAVASCQKKKQETSRRLTRRQQLEVEQIMSNEELMNKTKKEISRQRMLAKKLIKIPINFKLIPPDRFCEETHHLSMKMLDSARENVPETELCLLAGKLMDKFGQSYKYFVTHLLQNIWLKVHLRCLQEDAGVSDEEMAEMHPLHLLKLFDAVNNTHTPSVERTMKVLATEFGLRTPDIITELVEKMFKAFAEVAPDDFAKIAAKDAMAHAMALAVRGISIIG